MWIHIKHTKILKFLLYQNPGFNDYFKYSWYTHTNPNQIWYGYGNQYTFKAKNFTNTTKTFNLNFVLTEFTKPNIITRVKYVDQFLDSLKIKFATIKLFVGVYSLLFGGILTYFSWQTRTSQLNYAIRFNIDRSVVRFLQDCIIDLSRINWFDGNCIQNMYNRSIYFKVSFESHLIYKWRYYNDKQSSIN